MRGLWAPTGLQVDEAGRPIGQPPLHIHHAFLNLESSGSQHHTTDTRACLLLGRRCPGGAAMFAGAADFEQLQRVFSMRLTVEEPLNARAMVNDARPRGSAPMRWYVQLSLRTSPGRCEDAHSVVSVFHPGLLSKFTTLQAPACGLTRRTRSTHTQGRGAAAQLRSAGPARTRSKPAGWHRHPPGPPHISPYLPISPADFDRHPPGSPHISPPRGFDRHTRPDQ